MCGTSTLIGSRKSCSFAGALRAGFCARAMPRLAARTASSEQTIKERRGRREGVIMVGISRAGRRDSGSDFASLFAACGFAFAAPESAKPQVARGVVLVILL